MPAPNGTTAKVEAWCAANPDHTFTIDDVIAATGLPPKSARNAIDRLRRRDQIHSIVRSTPSLYRWGSLSQFSQEEAP